MVSIEAARTLALSFPEAEEQPHFEKTSFRIKKRIFATLSEKDKRCTVKLSPVDQSVFVKFNPSIIYPATGAWGKQGWTIIELKQVRKDLLTNALTTAYCNGSAQKICPSGKALVCVSARKNAEIFASCGPNKKPSFSVKKINKFTPWEDLLPYH